MDGRAEVLEGRPLPTVAAALREKYPQYDDVPVFAGEPVAVRLTPERVVSWRAGPPRKDA